MDIGNGLPNGNHNMANKLKEILKISGSAESSGKLLLFKQFKRFA